MFCGGESVLDSVIMMLIFVVIFILFSVVRFMYIQMEVMREDLEMTKTFINEAIQTHSNTLYLVMKKIGLVEPAEKAQPVEEPQTDPKRHKGTKRRSKEIVVTETDPSQPDGLERQEGEGDLGEEV
jgi:predicted Holliday junction resolvase-like endonuclease